MTEGPNIRSCDGLRRTEEHCGKCSEKKNRRRQKSSERPSALRRCKEKPNSFPFPWCWSVCVQSWVSKTWVRKQTTLSASTNVEIQAKWCSFVVEKKKLIMSFVKLNNPRVVLWPSAGAFREDIIVILFASCVRWLGSVMLAKDSRCFWTWLVWPSSQHWVFLAQNQLQTPCYSQWCCSELHSWLETHGATPTGCCLRTKTDRHPVESKTLCDFHLKPQYPSAAQEQWEKVKEEALEEKNKRHKKKNVCGWLRAKLLCHKNISNGAIMGLFIKIIINTDQKQGPSAAEVSIRWWCSPWKPLEAATRPLITSVKVNVSLHPRLWTARLQMSRDSSEHAGLFKGCRSDRVRGRRQTVAAQSCSRQSSWGDFLRKINYIFLTGGEKWDSVAILLTCRFIHFQRHHFSFFNNHLSQKQQVGGKWLVGRHVFCHSIEMSGSNCGWIGMFSI